MTTASTHLAVIQGYHRTVFLIRHQLFVVTQEPKRVSVVLAFLAVPGVHVGADEREILVSLSAQKGKEPKLNIPDRAVPQLEASLELTEPRRLVLRVPRPLVPLGQTDGAHVSVRVHARLSAGRDAAEDADGVVCDAQVRIYPVPAVFEVRMCEPEVATRPGGVAFGAHGMPEALDFLTQT